MNDECWIASSSCCVALRALGAERDLRTYAVRTQSDLTRGAKYDCRTSQVRALQVRDHRTYELQIRAANTSQWKYDIELGVRQPYVTSAGVRPPALRYPMTSRTVCLAGLRKASTATRLTATSSWQLSFTIYTSLHFSLAVVYVCLNTVITRSDKRPQTTAETSAAI